MAGASIVWVWLRERATRDQRGASLVEYAFLVGLIAMVCIGAVGYFGTQLNGMLNYIGGNL
jgi:Flp pilus assembly pilin Flp